MVSCGPEVQLWKASFVTGIRPVVLQARSFVTMMHWTVEVSWQQHTLGCYIIFCRREEVRLETELKHRELIELNSIKGDMKMVLDYLTDFKPDHYNHLQLGNNLPLLHIHGIPRYAGERNFAGKVWRDPTWVHLPPWTSEKATPELIHALRTAIRRHLPVQDD